MEPSKAYKIYDEIFNLRKRGIIPYYGFSSSVIKLIFLKYLCRYENVMLSGEEYRLLRNFQISLFEERLFEGPINDIWSMLQKIYDLEPLDIIRSYDFLFKMRNDEKRIIYDFLRRIELPNDTTEIKDLLMYVISLGEKGDVSKTANYSSNSSLISLASKILDVKPDESFMDCFCGLNKMAMNIVAGIYYGYEINSDIIVVSNMIMIMSGKQHFRIYNQDYYMIEHYVKVDKLFSEGPLGMNISEDIRWMKDYGRKNEAYSVKFAIDNLKENGKAFVVVPNSLLNPAFNNTQFFRKDIVMNLSAIISLPPLLNYTSMPISVMLLEKNKSSKNYIFIDASNKGNKDITNKTRSLEPEMIDLIARIIKGEQMSELARVVNLEEIEENQFSLLPSSYVKKEVKLEYRKVCDIENELKDLYIKLNNIIKREE